MKRKEGVSLDDLPSSYFQLASEIKEENNGLHKLRMRNDSIHSDLVELAIRNKAQIKAHKKDDRQYYVVEGMGVVISLCA